MSDDHALRVLYFASFAGAAIGSLVLTALGLSWPPALWATVWMLGYLIAARSRAPDYARTEEFGDNYYYFGFLLTLVALCGVLIQLGIRDDEDMGDTVLKTVLSQFGLALVTTILGLVVRTVILMHRRALDDLEERAEARMAQAFDAFVHSLDRLSAEADAFSQGFGERLKTIMTNVEASVVAFGDAVRSTTTHVAPLQANLGAASSAVRDSADSIVTTTGDLVQDLTALAGKIREVFTNLGASTSQAVQELSQAAARIGETMEGAEKSVRQPLTSLEAQVSNFGRQVDEIATNLGRFPDELSTAAGSAGKALAPLNGEVQRLSQSVGQIQGALRSFASALDGERAGISSSVRSLQDQIDTLAGLHAQLLEESKGASTALVQVRREIAAGVDFLISTLRQDSGPGGPARS